MTRTLVVLDSGNGKTGHAAVTYRTQDTCPTECPLYGKGCYARGRIFGIPERLGTEDTDDYAAVRALGARTGPGALPRGGLFRANVSGDVLLADGTLDIGYVNALSDVATARPDADVFTYSHAWRRDDVTPDMAPGVTVNASCETVDDIERATAAGWPTVLEEPFPAGDPRSLIGQTIAGRKVVQCPAQTRGLTCEQCRLCARPERKSTVAFALHGSGSRIAARQVTAARDAASCNASEG